MKLAPTTTVYPQLTKLSLLLPSELSNLGKSMPSQQKNWENQQGNVFAVSGFTFFFFFFFSF